jgi:hypothetical protein
MPITFESILPACDSWLLRWFWRSVICVLRVWICALTDGAGGCFSTRTLHLTTSSLSLSLDCWPSDTHMLQQHSAFAGLLS